MVWTGAGVLESRASIKEVCVGYSLLVKQALLWGGAGTMGRGQMNIDVWACG